MIDARVAVEHPVVPSQSEPGDVVLDDLLVVLCSDHGELTDWSSLDSREWLQQVARAHSHAEHDGLVDAVGWQR